MDLNKEDKDDLYCPKCYRFWVKSKDGIIYYKNYSYGEGHNIIICKECSNINKKQKLLEWIEENTLEVGTTNVILKMDLIDKDKLKEKIEELL